MSVNDLQIKDLLADGQNYQGREVTVSGWLRTLRSSKAVAFLEINDGSGLVNLQVVIPEDHPQMADIVKYPLGTALRISGRLEPSPAAGQAFELLAGRVECVAVSQPDYPLQKKRHSFEFLRSIAHLRPRTNTSLAVFRIRSLLAFAIHRFFNERNFVYVHTPIITGNDCEGAGQMFRVSTLDLGNPPRRPDGGVDFSRDFFGRETSLTVSGQLEVESFCLAFKRVYTFGPTFRAENSNTQRHASEFWMIEPEIAFADLADNMALAGEMLKYVVGYVLQEADPEIDFLNRFIDTGLRARLEKLLASDFAHLSYTEAVSRLQQSGRKFQFKPEWGCDLQTEHERYLSEELVDGPLFVTDYPREIKAFYMRLNEDGRTVAAMDLLVPGVGEIIGGSQREERLDVLEKRLSECGLPADDYWWYLELRKYGGVPHAGFGLGFERALMYLTGMENIRDVIPFPRTPNNAAF